MSVRDEFATVDLLLASKASTRAVDAFALSLIKCERQARKLFTNLVFQFPWCEKGNVPLLRSTLAAGKHVYFDGLVAGWDALYPRTIEDLVGTEHPRLRTRIDEATRHRNKIFHGQLTGLALGAAALEQLVVDLRTWCELLATAAQAEVGYDGFGRNSFRKNPDPDLWKKYKQHLADIEAYRAFVLASMTRTKK